MQRHVSLNPSALKFWNSYLDSLPAQLKLQTPYVEASFAGNIEITDSLADLYLSGKKWAGSGLVEDYESAGDPLPQIGNFWILLRSNGIPACILKTVQIEFCKFKDIPEKVAIAEGEGDLSIEYWKKTHAAFFSPHLKRWGIEDINHATVITEYFEKVAVYSP